MTVHSLSLLTLENVQIKVRLDGIDGANLKQPFSVASKKALSDLVFDKTVQLEETGNTATSEHSGTPTSARPPINRSMVEKGMAWFFHQYSCDKSLVVAEITARKVRVGL